MLRIVKHALLASMIIDFGLIAQAQESSGEINVIKKAPARQSVPSNSGGPIIGEIRAFAFGGNRNSEAIRRLRSLGWLECAGQELSTNEYRPLWNVISDTWGTSSPGNTFNVPDLRGMFLRGWDHGAGVDPDSNTKRPSSTRPNGATGDKVGSRQGSQLQSHVHSEFVSDHEQAGNTGITGWNAVGSKASNLTTSGPNVDSGSETRPINAYVMFCIYVGRPILDRTPPRE